MLRVCRGVLFSAGSQSLSRKECGHDHEDLDNNNGEDRGDKKAGDYHCHAPFSPLHIALQDEWLQTSRDLSLFHYGAARPKLVTRQIYSTAAAYPGTDLIEPSPHLGFAGSRKELLGHDPGSPLWQSLPMRVCHP